MAEETVECFNCGRPNPAWAHVCRHCGVPLRPDAPIVAPTGFVPSDERSLISMGAAIAAILAAIFLGFLLSSLNPTSPTVGVASPTPTETPLVLASVPPTQVAVPTATPAPTAPPTPTPVPLPGTIAFGTGVDANQDVTNPTDTFSRGTSFAHSVTMPEAFGVPSLGEQVARVNEDGSETEVAAAGDNPLPVDPASSKRGVVCCDAGQLLDAWGPGTYVLRVYRGEELVAQAQFILSE